MNIVLLVIVGIILFINILALIGFSMSFHKDLYLYFWYKNDYKLLKELDRSLDKLVFIERHHNFSYYQWGEYGIMLTHNSQEMSVFKGDVCIISSFWSKQVHKLYKKIIKLKLHENNN